MHPCREVADALMMLMTFLLCAVPGLCLLSELSARIRILLEIFRACDIIKLYSNMRVLETIMP